MVNIYLALDEMVLFNVSEEITAMGLWGKLQNLYEENSLTNKMKMKARKQSSGRRDHG